MTGRFLLRVPAEEGEEGGAGEVVRAECKGRGNGLAVFLDELCQRGRQTWHMNVRGHHSVQLFRPGLPPIQSVIGEGINWPFPTVLATTSSALSFRSK